MEQQMKMQGKDYITAAVLSLMNMVGMILASVMNLSGYTAVFYGAMAAFFVGILYVITCCKVSKFGAILVFSVVPCVYFFVSGVTEGLIGATGILLFALIAERLLKSGRRSGRSITISGLVYTLYMSVVGSAESFLFTDHYCDEALAHGIHVAVVEQMRHMYGFKPLWLAVIAATALMTFLGIRFGQRLMEKHLKKVGIL